MATGAPGPLDDTLEDLLLVLASLTRGVGKGGRVPAVPARGLPGFRGGTGSGLQPLPRQPGESLPGVPASLKGRAQEIPRLGTGAHHGPGHVEPHPAIGQPADGGQGAPVPPGGNESGPWPPATTCVVGRQDPVLDVGFEGHGRLGISDTGSSRRGECGSDFPNSAGEPTLNGPTGNPQPNVDGSR